MWLFTRNGFYSVVLAAPEDHQPPSTLAVRARVRDDLEALCADKSLLITKIHETPHRDYPYRCYMLRAEFSKLLAKLGNEIDYSNFKDEVAERQGEARAHWYTRVWAIMRHGSE